MLNWLPNRWSLANEERVGARSLSPFLPAADERLYVIGDVHGQLNLLKILMEKLVEDLETVPEDGRKTRLVLLGDYIDRGKNARDVLEVLHRAAGDLVLLKGNHEDALLCFLEEPFENRDWLQYGGLQTLESYGVTPPSLVASEAEYRSVADALGSTMGPHVDMLQNMPLYYRSGDVICVHAGIDPVHPDLTDKQALLWGRSPFHRMGSVPGVRIVHGHYDMDQAVVAHSRIGLDTGAYYSGRLTAARIDDSVKIIEANVFQAAEWENWRKTSVNWAHSRRERSRQH